MNCSVYTPHHSWRRQHGTGLVELMVALVIGIFILAGLGSVFLNMKQAFTSQDQLAQLQDSERMALTILTTTLQTAGYFPDPLVNTAATDLPAKASAKFGNFAAGQGVVGLNGGSTDIISSRYMTASGDGITDCLGNSNPASSGANQMVMNTFRVDANELQCSTDGGVSFTPLISGVLSLKVLYATDTLNNGAALQYLAPDTLTTNAWWSQVRNAQITVTLANPFASQPGQPSSIAWLQTVNLMNKP